MISLPTTEQILLDCSRELIETVAPAVSDPAVKLCVEMMEHVLRNAATRCAHEIAWMTDETEVMLSFAADVASTCSTSDLSAALAAAGEGRRRSLELAEVAREYSLAGEALSCAIEAAFDGEHDILLRQAVSILELRNTREQQIKGDWAMIGRG